MSHTYVYASNGVPIAARDTLAAAQTAAEEAESRYHDGPVDYRWDQEPSGWQTQVWELRVKGLTGRWAKAHRSIHEVPTN